MALDQLSITYAFGAGVASFFSPCSAGLLPAYVGYFVSARSPGPGQPAALRPTLGTGVRLGLSAAAGFFALLAGAALLILLVPFQRIAPSLPYLSILLGGLIAILGILLLLNRAPTLPLRIRLGERSSRSIFLFGVTYAFVSLGCTFPLFLSVVLGGASTGSSAGAAASILTYAAGMSLVMVTVTLALAVSQQGVARFLRSALPWVNRVAAIAMVFAGTYIVYYWFRILQS